MEWLDPPAALHQQDPVRKELSELFEKAAAHLPAAAVRSLASKSAGFTVAEKSDFPNKLPAMPKGDTELMRSFDPAFYQPILASSAGPLKVPAEMIPKSDRDPESDFFFPMSVPVDRFIPAAGGRLGLLVSEASDSVQIFDIALGDTIGKVQCPNGSLAGKWVIGGLDHWALVDKKQFRIERFELLGRAEPEILEPSGKSLPWNAFGAIMSPYRDDVAWIFLREPDDKVTVALFHFGTGVIRIPDISLIPQNYLKRWAENPNQGFRIDAPGLTLAPERGAEVLLTLDSTAFRMKGLGANYVFGEMSFPFSDLPAKGFVDSRSAKNWENDKLAETWAVGGEGWVATPLVMAPVHGSSRVLQVSKGLHIMVEIRDGKTGKCVLPIREIGYVADRAAGRAGPPGQPRYAAIAHRSSPRIAIFDFQANQLLSVKVDGWDKLETSPLVIQRKHGQEVRYPFKIPKDWKIQFSEFPGNGITVDRQAGEIVVTDASPKNHKPIMNFLVEGVDATGLRTLFPFRILADPEDHP